MMGLKKTRAAFARMLAVVLFSFAVPLWAQDGWVYLFENDNGECYLNRRSIKDHDSYVVGWVRAVYSNADDSNAMSMILYGAAKGSRQIRQIQSAVYGKNGRSIITISTQELEQMGKGQWQYCIPDSMGEAILEALMDAAGVRY